MNVDFAPAFAPRPTSSGIVESISIFAPAKLNLFLAVTGRRPDGYHDLVSVAAPLDFGDTLRVERAGATSLVCDDPGVPCDDTNLVLKAVRAFRREAPSIGEVRFVLEKRIPVGAGLGGGSSDAVATLRALNRLVGPERALPGEILQELAAELGSDCPLFLAGSPVVMRGRGERVEALPPGAVARLRGRRVLVFKPAFGISTPWAYGQMVAAAPGGYLPVAEAEARLAAWIADPRAAAESLVFNNMERPVFTKYLALPVLLRQLQADFGLEARLSGSGSACFALLREETDTPRVVAAVQTAWGESAFVREARIM